MAEGVQKSGLGGILAKKIKKLQDLSEDPKNLNLHTERGGGLMAKSIQELGFGDSMTVDKDGVVISGNQRLETLGEIGLDNPIVVQSDGSRPIVHQRIDLKAGTKRARELAIAQNQVGAVNLNWDVAELMKLDPGEVKNWFSDGEMAALMKDAGIAPEVDEGPAPQIDKAAELQKKWGCKTGDIYVIPSKTVKLTRVTCPHCGTEQDADEV
jgi:hypothetical protein